MILLLQVKLRDQLTENQERSERHLTTQMERLMNSLQDDRLKKEEEEKERQKVLASELGKSLGFELKSMMKDVVRDAFLEALVIMNQKTANQNDAGK